MTTIYIGPYMVIPAGPRQTVSRVRVCANHCDAPAIGRPAKFCGNCGAAVIEQDVPVEVVEPLPLRELADKWTDYVACPEYGRNHPRGHIWLPNHGGHGIRLEDGAEDDFVPLALSDIDSVAMLAKAKRYYEAFVAALKADFNVETFWEVGVVAYA